ncbi:MAG: DMT family transporter [Synergistales bacterium]
MSNISRSFPLYGETCAGLAAVLWGLNYPITKWVLKAVPAGEFLVVRFSLGGLLFVSIVAMCGQDLSIERKDRSKLAVLGLLCVGLYNVLWTLGIHRISSSTSALIISSSPLLVGLFCSLLGMEKMTTRRWLGLTSGFLGVVMIMVSGSSPQTGLQSFLGGNAMTALSAILFALYAVVAKPLLREHSAIKVTALAMLGGLPVIVPFGLFISPPASWVLPGPEILLGGLYVVLAGTVAAYFLWYRGVQRIGPVQTVMLHFLTPCVSLVFAPLLLGDSSSPQKILGAGIVFFSVVIFRLKKDS